MEGLGTRSLYNAPSLNHLLSITSLPNALNFYAAINGLHSCGCVIYPSFFVLLAGYLDPCDCSLMQVMSRLPELQIDELVVQAVKVDTTETEKINEIKSFTTLLSDMHSSLQVSFNSLLKWPDCCTNYV